MATYAGGLGPAPALYGPLPGLTRGTIGVPPPGLGVAHGPTLALGAATPAPAGLEDEPAVTVVGNGRPADWMAGGDLWFGRIHVLPRAPLAFGRVVAQADLPFEVFSASPSPAVLSAVSLTPGQGLSIPNVPNLGTVVAPFGSILDAASTPGNPIRLNLRAAPSGATTIDATARFSLVPGGDGIVEATGFRFDVLPFDYEAGFLERLEWLTNVLAVSGGREQRIARRDRPRRTFEIELLLEGDDRRRMQVLLFSGQGRAYGLPLWHERFRISAATAPAASTIPLVTTTDGYLAAGKFALLWKSAAVYDVVKVATVGPTSVTLDPNYLPANAYAVEDQLVPLPIVRLTDPVSGELHPANLETFRVKCLEVEDDSTPLAGDLSSLATAYGRPLLDGPNVAFDEVMAETYRTKVIVLDGDTGSVYRDQAWDRGKRQSEHGIQVGARADLLTLRKILNALRGRQAAFYVPTLYPDLRVVSNLSIGDDALQVAEVGYALRVAAREHKATMRITFTDGSSLLRRATAAVDLGGGVEELTLDATWPANRLASEVALVEFLELCRLDSDEIVLEHQTMANVRVVLPLIVVQDDP